MKKIIAVLILFAFSLCACSNNTKSAEQPSLNLPASSGKILVVISTEDSGQGSLRQVLQKARKGDVITFDPAVFPPENPATIVLLSGLPPLTKNNITLDASNAGVILDGSQAGGEWLAGFDIQSEQNVIMGFEIANFSGPGVLIQPTARNNVIGGDRSNGSGPFGEGNLIRNTSDGIALQGPGNTIRGNLIGTDTNAAKEYGNLGPGIFLEEGADNNIIGPGNIIAYNGTQFGGGIEIRSPSIQGTHITANNIHDNSGNPIHYGHNDLSNPSVLKPPVLLDYDLAQGTVNGVTCPNCAVEFFTTHEENEVFQGSAAADADGVFSFRKGTAFEGNFLKATANFEGKNTSPVSAPVNGTTRSLLIQGDNSLPRHSLPEIAFEELPANQIGFMHYVACDDLELADDYFWQIERMGYKWVRVNLEWFDWPEVLRHNEYSDFSITPCEQKVFDLFSQNDIPMLYTITYWDPEITVSDGYSRFRTQEEIDRYLDYTRFVVEQFKGKIRWYSILNEPNLEDGQRAVAVEDYINLARQVIPVIKEIDPQAGVVIGEVTPLDEMGSLDYLRTILASDVLPLADGIAWHGSSGNTPDYKPELYQNYPDMVDEIVNTAHNNGFTGTFFASELHWRTPETPQEIDGMPWFYSNAAAAKYYGRGMVLNLSKDFWITVGHEEYWSIPEVVQVINSLTTILAGAEPQEMAFTLDTTISEDIQSAAFSLPDGSRLLAVWRDGVAVDDDPGLETTLHIPGVQAQKVSGVDPLYGYQQELNFNAEDGIDIPNFMLHDYPVFIHLEGFSQ